MEVSGLTKSPGAQLWVRMGFSLSQYQWDHLYHPVQNKSHTETWNLNKKPALQSTSPFSPSFPLTTTVSASLFVPAPLFSCFSFFFCSLVKAFCPHLRPVSKWLNMRKPVARIRDKSFDTASLLFNSFFKYCYKNISLPLLGTNGFHQGTENSLLCSNVLPDFRAGYSPSLSKCYCDVKTAARCF